MKPSLNNNPDIQTTVKLPEQIIGSFNYVDCGARGDVSNSLLDVFTKAKYIGFDPELDAPIEKDNSGVFFPVALGQSAATFSFQRTQNLNCSSFFEPNREFLESFMKVGDFFRIVETVPLSVVALDDYMPEQGVLDIDFIELDTQGSELHILKGAEGYLKSTVLGVRVEIEFYPMYKDQPLFSNVDAYLQTFGFMLFDVERYHLRRKSSPPGIDSREQIVWGQALYLRDFRSFAGDPTLRKQKLGKLIMIASYYGFHGYALEILDYLTQEPGLLTADEKTELESASHQYISSLNNNRFVMWMLRLDKSFFHNAFRQSGKTLAKLYEAYMFVTDKQKYFWKD